jgi:serine/threonine protein kinase
VVDLRPLRLRERFNPQRLKREVDIMRRLHHPSIIQFIEVYEDPDHLMMVMEYCPGKELFDVILARKYLREEDARPIFAQICRALYYLHSLNIIHRDIKPENILILDEPDAKGYFIAKLLDFGLSKNAGRSEAKTFVGTPCYLAPEVEYTSKGLGGTYGLAADCWSLGAVLYVMLVARFPEFEQDINEKVVVKLAPALWNNVSNEAKDLIRSLMNTNPNARLTMHGVLKHPWLGNYRASDQELARIAVGNSELSHELQEEAEIEAEEDEKMNYEMNGTSESVPEITAGGNVIKHQAMVIRQNDNPYNSNNAGYMTLGGNPAGDLKLSPLLHLQRSIATCFEQAHVEYADYPEVAAQIRRGAMLCRNQVIESTKMLRKVEQTAKEVLEMFPDLELAIEEDEPKLATDFFNMVKSWVVELKQEVDKTQQLNKASMNQIQRVVEQSSIDLKEKEKVKLINDAKSAATVQGANAMAKQFFDNLLIRLKATSNNGQIDLNDINLDSNNVLELFLSLFGPAGSNLPGAANAIPVPPPHPAVNEHDPGMKFSPSSSPLKEFFLQSQSQQSQPPQPPTQQPQSHQVKQPSSSVHNQTMEMEEIISPSAMNEHQQSYYHKQKQPSPNRKTNSDQHATVLTVDTMSSDEEGPAKGQQLVHTPIEMAPMPHSPKPTASRLAEALHNLRQVSCFSILLFPRFLLLASILIG